MLATQYPRNPALSKLQRTSVISKLLQSEGTSFSMHKYGLAISQNFDGMSSFFFTFVTSISIDLCCAEVSRESGLISISVSVAD